VGAVKGISRSADRDGRYLLMPPLAKFINESPRGVAATGSLSLRRKFMSDKLTSGEVVSLGKLGLRLDRNGAFAREISVGGEELFRGVLRRF
jgi:hypothetical protein